MGNGLMRRRVNESAKASDMPWIQIQNILNTHNQVGFFRQVYITTMRKCPVMQRELYIEDLDNLTETENMRLVKMSTSLKKCFEIMVDFGVRGEIHHLKTFCLGVGERHTHYSDNYLDRQFWDVFVFALTDLIEQGEQRPPMTGMLAWQKFLRMCIEYMRKGYEERYKELHDFERAMSRYSQIPEKSD